MKSMKLQASSYPSSYSHFMSKRGRPSSPPTSTPPPLTPPPKQTPKPTSISKPRTHRSLSFSSPPLQWHPLSIPISELSLPLTLPTGQTFRWRRTSPSAFSGPIGPYLVSLRHHPEPSSPVSFHLHNPSSPSSAAAAAHNALREYLNLDVSLADLWHGFTDADERFADLARRFGGGARVLRQDPLECLFQFLCSSNNNIGRIEKMVGVISSFGESLGSVGGFEFHQFPTLERLALVSERELRDAGFGYRAKYIVGTVKALQEKPGGGVNWLASLRGLELPQVIDALCTLPGVGPKVAACIALFSLDQHHAIPVDTHVWQIATQYLMPELAGKSLTPKLSSCIADAFVAKFGKYAGWAQNVLFIGELPSQKLLDDKAGVSKSANKKQRIKKAAVELPLEGD
ncbi:N-glycosylase/DNA lyase protein [Dioscorea alata]|uniref:N-glycosylase/DNA lyase protein n=1 Tax=Dioscorea alata TaxID=55571 RepID=A0ACB7W0E6_DIOAL|nr:N-glycosylase/DNA lyase protein [Dioscorea alata]